MAVDNGGFFVAWEQGIAGNGGHLLDQGTGIFGQFYDSDGTKLGDQLQINSIEDGNQYLPDMVSIENGVQVVWNHFDPLASTFVVRTEAITYEDAAVEATEIALSISSALTDTDGSETLSVTIEGMPEGAELSAGTQNADGSWTLTPSELDGLTLTLANALVDDLTLTITATSTETSNGDAASTTTSLLIKADEADVPTLSVSAEAVSGGSFNDDLTNAVEGLQFNGTPFQLNSYTAARQWIPETTALEGGGFVATWWSENQDGSGYAVIVRTFNDDGSPRSNEEILNVDVVGDQIRAHPTALPGGGFVAVWQSQKDGYSENYMQIFDASGARVGDPVRTDFEISDQFFHNDDCLFINRDGNIVFTGGTKLASGEYQLLSNVYDTSGNLLIEGQAASDVLTTPTETIESALLAGGGHVTTWTGFDASGRGVFAQIYDQNGAMLGGSFRVHNATNDWQMHQAVEALPDGGFVVTWDERSRDGSSWGVYGQKFDVNGSEIGDEFRVNTSTAGQQSYSDLVALPDGGFFAVWQDHDRSDGTEISVTGQQFNADGIKVGGEVSMNFDLADKQQHPDITLLENGKILVTFSQESGDTNAFGQIFDIIIDGEVYVPSPVASNTISLDIDAALTDTDGSETLSVTIEGMPEGAELSAGTQNADGSWSLSVDDLDNFRFTAPENITEDFDLTVTATSTEISNGDTASSLATLSFDVAEDGSISLIGISPTTTTDDLLTG